MIPPDMEGWRGVRDITYLGDGVYVGHDGYHVLLALGDGGSPGRPIALEPPVMAALDRYRECHEVGGRDDVRTR